MPQDINFYFAIAGMSFFAMILIALTIVKIWNEWIGYKRAELESQNSAYNINSQNISGHNFSNTSRIEVADLKERVRKLEAIAAGIDP